MKSGNSNNIEQKEENSENTLLIKKKSDSIMLDLNNSKQSKVVQNDYTYNWDKFKPHFTCSCFSFATQLVLIAAMGSFTFGFNIGLLNTALDTIIADFKLCNPVSYNSLPFNFSECQKDYASDKCVEISSWATKYSRSIEDETECPERKWWVAGVQCALLVGSAIGAIATGYAIKFGRRFFLMLVMFLFIIGLISSITSTSMVPLLWARLITGFGVGMVSVGSPTYISEVTPSHSRGFYGVFHQVAICTGIVIPMLLGLPLSLDDNVTNDNSLPLFQKIWWRVMLGFGLLPVIFFLLYMSIYGFETPVWYVENKKYKDAEKCLQLIYSKKDVSEELNSIVKSVETAETYKQNKITYWQLFTSKKYRLITFVGVALAMFQQIGGINFFMMSSKDAFINARLSVNTAHIMTIVMSLMNLVLTFPAIYLIERFGRRPLLLWGSIGQCLFLLPATISYWFEYDKNNPSKITQILSIILVIGFVAAFALAFGPVVWVYLFEIYPIEIKDSASSLATAFNWISAIIIVFVAQVIHNSLAYTLFSLFQILATLFIYFFMKESKGYRIGTSPYIK